MKHRIARAGIAAALCIGLLGGSAATAAGFDPASVDILGLRLGATERAVIRTLQRQGIRAGGIVRTATACMGPARCEVILAAAAHDGDLVVTLRGDPKLVAAIAYRFHGRVMGEPDIIMDAVLEHFGPPDEPRPMRWCGHPGPGRGHTEPSRRCRDARPSLRFTPSTLTLTLTSGESGD